MQQHEAPRTVAEGSEFFGDRAVARLVGGPEIGSAESRFRRGGRHRRGAPGAVAAPMRIGNRPTGPGVVGALFEGGFCIGAIDGTLLEPEVQG